MTDWDAIFGETALGIDLAKVDVLPGDAGHAPAPPAPAVHGEHAGRSAAERRGGRGKAFRRYRRIADESHAHACQPGVSHSTLGPATGPLRSSLQLTLPAPTLPDRDAIFRQEALEFRARGRDTPGGVVRLGAQWIRWASLVTVVLVVVGVASMWLIRTNESTTGPAVIDGRTGTVAALLPAVVGPDLASSHGLTIALPSGRSVSVSGLHAQLADDTTIRKAGLAPLTQAAILVTGRLNPGVSVTWGAHLHTQVSVVLRSESLADVIARQFNAMLGQEAAP